MRREFEGLRSRVLSAVAARLGASGVELDERDLDEAYALAWQGLYSLLLEEQSIENPYAWLTLVTFRRALEEHRSLTRLRGAGEVEQPPDLELDACAEDDLAGELDSRIQMGQLLEGLAGQLDDREREAATLCYLQGLSRAEAAGEMGISEGRMRKLMEGVGAGDPGVSGKVGAIARVIEQGRWCDSQGSLMRALAYGILDRDGERYRLALSHQRSCPACRAYVVSLRGLAVALPPTLLPGSRLALAGLAGGAAGSGASGAAGVSGAGGGGLALAGGPLAAKFAVGCLVAVGVGAGCVGLQATHAPRSRAVATHVARVARAEGARPPAENPVRSSVHRTEPRAPASVAVLAPPTAVVATREFGLEPGRAATNPKAPPAGEPHVAPAGDQAAAATAAAASASASSAAREFGPG
jgi:DNA-directed RNA polymerase specialized sigma24 family protein